MANRKTIGVTQWLRIEKHVKAANVLETCRKESSGFANFSSSDQGASARSLHRQNALLYRWKFELKSSDLQDSEIGSYEKQVTTLRNQREKADLQCCSFKRTKDRNRRW